MKTIRVHRLGGPEVLVYEEIADPEPGQGEALVEVSAAGVNFVDAYERRGLYKRALPFIPGSEGAGTVVAIGDDVTTVEVGDRVAWGRGGGSYAQYAVLPAGNLVPVPDGISLRQAAAVMLQGMTAHYLSHSTYPLQSGETALIHAAAGGVGHLLVQLAKLRGARVIGTCSTMEKAALARHFGADEIILYTQEDFQEAVDRLTDGEGVDVVYDSVGKTTFMQSLDCLKPRGYLVLFGQSSGPVEPFDPQVLNAKGSLYVTRPTLRHYVATRDELLWRAGDLFDWLAAREIEVQIDRTFPLAEATDAHRYIEGRNTKGKLLLIPSGQ
ncbi:MAG: quinone oxidoreductase [Anaerolineae bacterium]